MKIFIDTSALYAMYNISDPLHEKSIVSLDNIPDEAELITSSNVVGETISLLSMRLSKNDALSFYNEVLFGIETVIVDLEIFNDAIALFKKIKSKNVSFVDCTSFVICKNQKIDFVFTFDKHFGKQGIKVL